MTDEHRTIGGLKVVRMLGKGGMSEVYEVEDPRLGSRHALKLFAYPKDDAEVRSRFEAEGRLLAQLSHPRIVKVSDLGTDEESGRPYFVMDLVLDPTGAPRTLGDVQDGEADEETVGKWYDDIRDGLAYIHAKGIVHRDLKLQNVMVGADGHAVIVDFGISGVLDLDKGEAAAAADPVQTIVRIKNGQNLVMGSLGYMAPELEMGLPATQRSDWFALGVLVYKLLTGIWCDAKTDVSGTLDTYDPVWKRIIPKLLHSNPEGRECLSFAEERAKDREELEASWESRWLAEKSRGHLARHLARYALAAAAILMVVLCWQIREANALRETAGLTFDKLFAVPDEATTDEKVDARGNITMYSRDEFERARVDALVLTHQTISDLTSGNIPKAKAIYVFEQMYDAFDNNESLSPLDALVFGDEVYSPFCRESGAVKMLLGRAVDILKNAP